MKYLHISNECGRKLIDGCAIAFHVIANFKNGDDISEKRDALCLKYPVLGKIGVKILSRIWLLTGNVYGNNIVQL